MSDTPVDANDMSLSIHDLEWNKKKQDMIINLGLNSHSQTDETPTPTRFIRNCEQVGLFQDLQHVNPFDEEFKKAIENPSLVTNQKKSNDSLEETTLHTPKINPQHEIENTNFVCSVSPPTEYTFSNIEHTNSDGDKPLVIDIDTTDIDLESSTASFVKNVSLHNTQKTPSDDVLIEEKEKENALIEKLQRIRESNKASQRRSRQKRQKEFEKLKIENKRLKVENSKLKNLVFCLKSDCSSLQQQLDDISRQSPQSQLKVTSNITNTLPASMPIKHSAIISKSQPLKPALLVPQPALNNPNPVILVCTQPVMVQQSLAQPLSLLPITSKVETSTLKNSELKKKLMARARKSYKR